MPFCPLELDWVAGMVRVSLYGQVGIIFFTVGERGSLGLAARILTPLLLISSPAYLFLEGSV